MPKASDTFVVSMPGVDTGMDPPPPDNDPWIRVKSPFKSRSYGSGDEWNIEFQWDIGTGISQEANEAFGIEFGDPSGGVGLTTQKPTVLDIDPDNSGPNTGTQEGTANGQMPTLTDAQRGAVADGGVSWIGTISFGNP